MGSLQPFSFCVEIQKTRIRIKRTKKKKGIEMIEIERRRSFIFVVA